MARDVKPTPADTSDKNHLISVIQEQTGSSKAAAKEALDAVLDTIAITLKEHHKLQLLGFGSFEVSKRPERMGRNPSTGAPMKIKASKTVRFKPSTNLKGSV